MRIDRLGDLGGAPEVLRAVGDATNRLDLPPPAALTGDWFGASAVIAPSVSIAARRRRPTRSTCDRVRTSTAVGGGWIGYLSYPDPGSDGRPARIPEAAGGWTDCVLRCDRDRQWWYESLSGAPMPDWLAEALAAPAPRSAPARAYRIDWDAADRQAHRAGVLACLEAIRAGEVYQACVCTQFTGTIAGEPLDFFIDGVARTAPARAAYVAGAWGAVASLSPELFLCRRGDVVTSSPIKGTLPLTRSPVGAAGLEQGRRREHHDRRPGAQRPGPGRGHRIGHRARTAGGAARAGRVAPGVDGVGADARRAADVGTARRRLPACLGHRHAQTACTTTDFAVGTSPSVESIAAQSVWRRR